MSNFTARNPGKRVIWRTWRRKSGFHPGTFAACLDAALGFDAADEVESEVADDGHVLPAGTAAAIF
jgi:hypothetical protein